MHFGLTEIQVNQINQHDRFTFQLDLPEPQCDIPDIDSSGVEVSTIRFKGYTSPRYKTGTHMPIISMQSSRKHINYICLRVPFV